MKAEVEAAMQEKGWNEEDDLRLKEREIKTLREEQARVIKETEQLESQSKHREKKVK